MRSSAESEDVERGVRVLRREEKVWNILSEREQNRGNSAKALRAHLRSLFIAVLFPRHT